MNPESKMTCTRFAPSPTGYLHVGGARTAIFCYLQAHAQGGKFILRIEDTDLDRSTRAYEESMCEDLKWLGIPWDLGPFRQSERLEIYQEVLDYLLSKKLAYPCFCSDEELEKKRELALSKNEHPHYDGICFSLTKEQIEEKKQQNIPFSYRFKVTQKSYSFLDAVRGEVNFPEFMVGDFVIIRSNKLPVYNYACVIDDWKMQITDCIRAEEHLPNTLRQLMLYEALAPLGAKAPKFAHVSLLVGADRQKLSKRHGATSVEQYRKEGFLPQAVVNYLTLLGWSHPKEVDIFTPEEIFPYFNLDRFSKSPAVFDEAKLRWMNAQYLRNAGKTNLENLLATLLTFLDSNHEFISKDKNWQLKVLELFLVKMETFKDFEKLYEKFLTSNSKIDFTPDEEFHTICTWPSTKIILDFVKEQLKLWPQDSLQQLMNLADFEMWSEQLKTVHKVKGAQLFKGLRAILTLASEGVDLKGLISLTPKHIIIERVKRFPL